MIYRSKRYDLVDEFQTLVIGYATGTPWNDSAYQGKRQELLADAAIKKVLPAFVLSCRDIRQFWEFIQPKFKTYRERRAYLREQFVPLLQAVERSGSPADNPVSEVLATFDSDHVHKVWTRAMDRRTDDPEGAITSARSLLESVCKHILDQSGVEYDNDADLPKLYRLTADALQLAPSQQTEPILKQIFGGCQTVVEGLGALRNKLSDAHGRGKKLSRPKARHAALAVNLAGAMATFLVESCQAQDTDD